MTRRSKGPALPDPGIIPGGIRDRAMRAVLERGPVPEDMERTRASQEYWARFRAEQAMARERMESSSREEDPAHHKLVVSSGERGSSKEDRAHATDAGPKEDSNTGCAGENSAQRT